MGVQSSRAKQRLTWRQKRAALERVARLGPLQPVQPCGHLADGAPDLRSGEVYVMPYGQVFHLGWCDVLGREWDAGTGLLVVERERVGQRRCCQVCTDDLAQDWSEGLPGLFA